MMFFQRVKQKKGKLFISHRYNQTPLLYSYPGGFNGSWSYKTYPIAKVLLFPIVANVFINYFYNALSSIAIIFFFPASERAGERPPR